MIGTREEVFAADVLAVVRVLSGEPTSPDLARLRAGQVVVGMAAPLAAPEVAAAVAGRGAALFSLELVPRTTRAQSMDVLSSQANIAGYKAVLLAAEALPKVFPLLTTAAGTIAAGPGVRDGRRRRRALGDRHRAAPRRGGRGLRRARRRPRRRSRASAPGSSSCPSRPARRAPARAPTPRS